MVNRKVPKSLKHFCFEAIPALITPHILKLVHRTDASAWFLKFYGLANVDREEILAKQVSRKTVTFKRRCDVILLRVAVE
jgi:hypothetical protein